MRLIKNVLRKDACSNFFHFFSFYENSRFFPLIVQWQMTILLVFLQLYLITFTFEFNLWVETGDQYLSKSGRDRDKIAMSLEFLGRDDFTISWKCRVGKSREWVYFSILKYESILNSRYWSSNDYILSQAK